MCVLCFAPTILPPCSIPYARVCRVSQTKTIFSDHLRAFTEGCGCKPHIGPIVRGSSAACLFFCLWCGLGFAPAACRVHRHARPHPVAPAIVERHAGSTRAVPPPVTRGHIHKSTHTGSVSTTDPRAAACHCIFVGHPGSPLHVSSLGV